MDENAEMLREGANAEHRPSVALAIAQANEGAKALHDDETGNAAAEVMACIACGKGARPLRAKS
jgi:hypothetical protein